MTMDACGSMSGRFPSVIPIHLCQGRIIKRRHISKQLLSTHGYSVIVYANTMMSTIFTLLYYIFYNCIDDVNNDDCIIVLTTRVYTCMSVVLNKTANETILVVKT